MLLQFWTPAFDRYVEPFMGSACLFYAISPRRAVLGDLNEGLVETFRTVRARPMELSSPGSTAFPKVAGHFIVYGDNIQWI